jgi:hypothetical protein
VAPGITSARVKVETPAEHVDGARNKVIDIRVTPSAHTSHQFLTDESAQQILDEIEMERAVHFLSLWGFVGVRCKHTIRYRYSSSIVFSSVTTAHKHMAPPPFMDTRTAPLNPCSLETIPEPVILADGRSVWPLMLSCYQLEQDTGRRVGHMDLSLIEVPDIASHASAMPLQFDKNPCVVLAPETSSGVLDGKWSSMPVVLGGTGTAGDNRSGSSGPSTVDKSWCFASAHSSGEIRMHSFQVAARNENDAGASRYESDPLYTVNYLGRSDAPHAASGTAAPPPLCLSLGWDDPAAYKQKEEAASDFSRIVSTYSNGRVAIHDATFGSENRQAQLIERDSWDAHNMFTSPAEVWSACFAGRNVILSGGDEGQVKVWDIRATTRPMQVLKAPFDAGVTCLSPHPVMEHITAIGSCKFGQPACYLRVLLNTLTQKSGELLHARISTHPDDENVCLVDIRFMSPRRPLFKSGNLGGGIWRIKWHPYTHNRMLVGAMHAGCRVLNFHSGDCLDGSPSGSFSDVDCANNSLTVKCTKKFTEHDSMAYGADWLVCPHPTQNGYYEAAARYVSNRQNWCRLSVASESFAMLCI